MKWKPLQQLFFMSKLLFYGLVLQVCFTGLLIAGDGLAQDKVSIEDVYISLELKDASLEQTLEAITDKTNFKFAFEQKNIESFKSISTSVTNESLAEVLRGISKTTDLSFKRVNDNIFVSKKRLFSKPVEEDLINSGVFQGVTVTGKVLSGEDNTGLPGVNIIVQGTSIGTVSDLNGNYSLEVPGQSSVLVFSSVGYVTEEVSVGGRTVIDITLNPDITALSEVVVIGYGTQKRTSVTGAVSSVDSKQITDLAVPGVDAALQGRVPGVNVTTNGSPGANPIVRIRGIGSITGSSDPLYVVDGFPTGGINNFDPRDIESVEVLKDAAAAAIYGSRAANGVILITTKTGAKGKGMSAEVEAYYGVQEAWKQFDLLKRDQYLEYGTELLTNAGSTLPSRFSNMNVPIYEGTSQTYAQTETDWQDEVFRTAPIYQLQASVANTTDRARLYTSAGMFSQDGIMIGTDFKRYNYRFNSEVKLSDHVTIGQTMTIANTQRNNLQESGGRTILQHVIRQVPYLPVHDPTLLGGYRTADNNDGSDPENPVRIQVMDKNFTSNVKVLGTAYMNIKFLQNFNYKFTIGADYSDTRTTISRPMYYDGFTARLFHELQDNRSTVFSPLFQNQLTFDKQFGKHYVNVTAVAERQDNKFTALNASAQQSSNLIYSMQGGQNQTIGLNDTNETTLLSYLARVNYEYAGKYLLSASIRRDGFSGFAPGNKWGNFPGLSAGWRVSEEQFMSSVSGISELKVRASYGSLGVNNVGPFDWQSLISLTTIYPFNNVNQGGSFFDALPNNELSWETTTMTNFGVDMGFFDDKLTFTAEYFQRKVDNLLLDVPLALSLGYPVPFRGNVGKMENSGFEFMAGWRKSTGDFTFNLNANIGTVTNKVTDLYVPGSTIFRGQNNDFGGFDITKTEAGQPVQGFFGWVTDGLFQSESEIFNADGTPVAAVQNLPLNEDGTVDLDEYRDPDNKGQYTRPGDIRFVDLDGNGVINSADRDYLGSFLPDFTYGLNFDAQFKNFDVTLFIQGVQGNEVYNGTKVLSQGMLRLFNSETAVLDAWTPQNPNTDIPRAVNGDPNQNTRTSDRFVEDGSYMRIKNLTIGYSLPTTFLQTFANGSLKKIRFYASFQNLLTITNYTGYDPEIGTRVINNLTQGIDYGQYPQPRTMMGGIQIGF